MIARDVVTTEYASPVAIDTGEEEFVVGYEAGAVVVHALDGEQIRIVDRDVASGAVVVRAADIDGDGVLDVVSAAAEDDTIASIERPMILTSVSRRPTRWVLLTWSS